MVGVHQHLLVNQDRCMAYLLHIYEQYRTVVTIRFKFNILKLAAVGRVICDCTFGLFPSRKDEWANSRWPFLLKTAFLLKPTRGTLLPPFLPPFALLLCC